MTEENDKPETKKSATPRRGCHKCRVKPEPGSDYASSPCASCGYADSRQIGHGRTLSLETAGRHDRFGQEGGGGLTFDGEQVTAGDDADADGGELGEVAGGEVADGMDPERREMLDAFGSFMAELSALGLTARESVFGLLGRRKLHETAERLGVSPQAIEQAQRTALRQMPVLRVLLRRRS